MDGAKVKLIECPRDAVQGIHAFIPTELKVRYLQQLLKVGFHTIDFGSFVSHQAIPQMADTHDVIQQLDISDTNTRLLAIVANLRGAIEASEYDKITYLGYPFSISEVFQMRNTNATIEQSLGRVEAIQEVCATRNKSLVIYVSMGFGNPYGETWNVNIAQYWVDRLADMGIKIMSLSDTIGVATPETISYLFGNLIPPYPDVEFGAHLHTTPDSWGPKIEAAFSNGCFRFDGALKGYGGCPMAKDELVGNMPMENLLRFMHQHGELTGLDMEALTEAEQIALEVYAYADR